MSSVVGALFFTVLMIAGFSVLSLALDAQTDIVSTQRIISDIEIKKQQEAFGIMASTDGNDILNLSIENQGQNSVEISSIWITNKTLTDQPATRYTINYDDAFVPSGFTINVLSSQTLQMMPDVYDLKIISTLGSIKTVELVSGSGGSTNELRAEIMTDPPDVIIGQNVTVAMIVTNTGDMTIKDVQPEIQTPIGGTGNVVAFTPHTPSLVDLGRGESVMFTWDYQVNGNSGQTLIFSAYAKGDFEGFDVYSEIVSDTSILRDPSDGGDSSTELIVLTQDLLARPEIFVTMPVPFGRSIDLALWGVNIVNPVNKELEVSKIVFSTTSTRYVGGDEIFDDGNGNLCGAQHVDVTMVGTWSCPMPNQLMWESLDAPVKIPGLSTMPFLAFVKPGKINQSTDFLETVPVGITVYTTLGQFGKSGYATSFHDAQTTTPSLYLTDVPGSTASANIFLNATTSSGSIIKLNVTLADFDLDPTKVIQGTDSRVIINIPKGWSNPSVIKADGFTIEPIAPPFPDGSSQIIATLISDMTGVSDAQTIEFQITAPTVTSTQLYVMYVLADGLSNSGVVGEDVAVGSLAEIVLKVIP